ncbi:hypothetical protein TRBR_01270 [Treponema bryantii]|nr:hypothetical protein TRBR_01270 [Treponema bryantii]
MTANSKFDIHKMRDNYLKRKSFIFLISLFLISVVYATDPVPEGEIFVNDKMLKDFPIGADISSYNIEMSKANLIMINPSQFAPYFNLYESPYWYRIAVLNNRVRAIFVNDAYFGKRFKTEEGIYLEMSMKQVKDIIPEINFKKINGWGYEALLKSGWKIVFANNDDNAEVLFIYRD